VGGHGVVIGEQACTNAQKGRLRNISEAFIPGIDATGGGLVIHRQLT
jgi:hypothetical protein